MWMVLQKETGKRIAWFRNETRYMKWMCENVLFDADGAWLEDGTPILLVEASW